MILLVGSTAGDHRNTRPTQAWDHIAVGQSDDDAENDTAIALAARLAGRGVRILLVGSTAGDHRNIRPTRAWDRVAAGQRGDDGEKDRATALALGSLGSLAGHRGPLGDHAATVEWSSLVEACFVVFT